MSQGGPLFCDITWHASGNALSSEPTSSLTFAMAMINHIGLNTMLHITACKQQVEDIDRHLNKAKDLGVSSLLLLRGGEFYKSITGNSDHQVSILRDQCRLR